MQVKNYSEGNRIQKQISFFFRKNNWKHLYWISKTNKKVKQINFIKSIFVEQNIFFFLYYKVLFIKTRINKLNN